MTTQHTPGPWKVIAVDWSPEGNARFEIEGITRTGMADARLIAAAPDLLAALEGMEKWASSIHDGYPPSTASIAAAPYREAARAAIAKATGRVVADDAAPECTCAAKDMTFGRCCKLTPNKCKWCGHDIHAHDKQYGCAEDGCDCETPNAGGKRHE